MLKKGLPITLSIFMLICSLLLLCFIVEFAVTELEKAYFGEIILDYFDKLTFEVSEEKYQDDVEIVVSAVGDCVLGSDDRFQYEGSFNYVFEMEEKNYSYFFSGVEDVLEKDDLTIANLETSLTNFNKKTRKTHQDRPFWFKGSPDYTKILIEGSVEAVNIANNHTHDYTEWGYIDTMQSLTSEGIEYFGYDNVLIKEIKGVRIGLLGFNELGINEVGTNFVKLKKEVEESIKSLKDKTELIIVSFHWGEENVELPNKNQVVLARTAIDAGADLVLGHHSHIIQGIENYKGRHIVYSLGNFVYGGKHSLTDRGHSFIYQEKFIFNDGLLISNRPNIIPVCISSSLDKNDFRPRILEYKEENEVREKLLERSIALKYLVNDIPVDDINSIILARQKICENKNIKIEVPKIVGGNSKDDNNDLVNLKQFIPDLEIDTAYAKADNFTGKKLYYNDMPYLRLGTAKKLKAANETAKKLGYKIKLWDGYRPPEVQWLMWEACPDSRYIASPFKTYSYHNRGVAVDVTLVDAKGRELDMPSKFDDLSDRANRSYRFATEEQENNSLLLEKIMYENGFQGIFNEWWHFVDADASQYGIVDIEKVLLGPMLGVIP